MKIGFECFHRMIASSEYNADGGSVLDIQKIMKEIRKRS